MTGASVHAEIIARGFREAGRKAGAIRYTRGNEVLLHRDYGPSAHWPDNPDANRHVLQYFKAGRKRSGGTAWQAILQHHVDANASTAWLDLSAYYARKRAAFHILGA